MGGDSSDIPLEKKIDAASATLVELLDEQRRKDRATNQSFWPNCEAAGEGYVGCNPLNFGECPDEAEFATTFADKPFANTWSKDPVTGEMERCIPAWLKAKPATRSDRQASLKERIIRALIDIEKNYPKIAKDSAWQWNTPCSEATNLNQCEIMRDEPSYDKHGKLTYAQHGSRCMWRPLEDSEAYINDPSGPKCTTRFDHPYKTKPLTMSELDTIKQRLAASNNNDDHITNMKEMTTPYGTQRLVTTDELQELQDAMVTLPIMPLSYTTNKFNQWLQKPVDRGGFGSDFSIDPRTSNDEAHNMYVSVQPEYGDLYNQPPAKIIEALKKLCGETDGKYIWHPDNFGTGMGEWLVPASVAAAEEDDPDNKMNFKLKTLIAKDANKRWHQFAIQNVKEQQMWSKTMEALMRRLYADLSDEDSRKKLELSLAPIVQSVTRNNVKVDLSLKDLNDGINSFFVLNGDLLSNADVEGQPLHKVELKFTPGKDKTLMLQDRLQEEPLLRFQPPDPRTSSQEKEKYWRDFAARLAMIMWRASIVPPSEKQERVSALRTLHNRGIGPHNFQKGIAGKVKVSTTHSALSPSEAAHMQKTMRDIKRLAARELGKRLSSKIVAEKSQNIQNRATLAYFAALNAERDIEERYRLAIAQIPKMLQYKFNRAKLVQFTMDEIKRRFHNEAGHPLYYNREGLRREAAEALIQDAHAKLERVKKTLEDPTTSELRKALEHYREILRNSVSNKVEHKDLRNNDAQDFQSKFGPGSYIDPITGSTAKQLQSMARF